MIKKYYLALLRGINVGGNNIIKMVALKACFEKMGFSNIATYIQSGNVIFAVSAESEISLEEAIEQALSTQFKYKSCVVLIPFDILKQIVNQAPKDFGKSPDKYRYDVIFLKKPLTVKKLLKVIETKESVDNVFVGSNVLYFSRLISKATQSRLSRLIQKPEYKYVTIRNWNTTMKLLALMEKVQKENESVSYLEA